MNFDKKDRMLFDKEKNLTIIFNEKSACSFFVKWFFYQIDLYEECEKYHIFPHKYRMQVFNVKNKDYTIEDIKKSNKIILVRNPFTRAVSSYLHSVKNGYISEFKSIYSFYDFVKYLKNIDIKKCNGHHRSQFHPLVLEDDINIIKVENLFNDIKSIENKFNLKSSPLNEIENSLNFHKMRKDKSSKDFCYNKKFTKEEVESCKGIEYKRIDNLLIEKNDNIGVPDYKYFYNDELKSDILNIYKDDFKYFNYDKNFYI